MKFERRRSCACLAILSAALCAADAYAKETPPARHTVMADGHPMAVWSRSAPQPKHAILILHGRTWSALPNYDLQVPQRNRSILAALMQRGYAAYALDLRGYGSTPRNTDGWNTPNQASGDVAAILRWIAERHPKLDKPALFGWSMGSQIAHLTAQQHPELLSDLILYGYPRNLAAPPTVPPTPNEPPRETNTAARAASDFISPRVTTQELIDTYVAAALKADPVRADWRQLEDYRELDAAKIKSPTLVIHGERDPLAPMTAQSTLFVGIGNPDKQWIVLAGGDHAAMLENTHAAFIAAIDAFVKRPRLR
jgi:pimeloyl-ACP methyl ester carboxylesterase